MNDLIVNYIKNMKKTGYTTSQIRTQLLRKYPSSFVDKYIKEALEDSIHRLEPRPLPQRRVMKRTVTKTVTKNPSETGTPTTVFPETEERISLGQKIIGILFKPFSIFKKLQKEDMIHSFYFHFSLFFTLSLVISIFLYLLLPSPAGIGMAFYYLLMMVIQGMLFPFPIAGYYYLFLKLVFRMEKSFDQAYKATLYSISQFMILVILVLIFSLSAYFSNIIAFIGMGLMFLLWIYNTITLIKALTDLCNVSWYKAAITVLLPIFLLIAFLLYAYFAYPDSFSSLPIYNNL